MKTFKRTFEKKTLPIVESLKRELLRHYDAILIDKIRRDAITLRRLYECECNGCTRDKFSSETWAQYDKNREAQMAWVEKRVETVRSRIERNCEALGLYYYHQTDPRGCALYISNNPISDNCYSTSAIAVY